MLLTKKTRNQLRKPLRPHKHVTLPLQQTKDNIEEMVEEIVEEIVEVKEVEKTTKNTKKKNNKE